MTNEHSACIVRSVIDLGHNLGLHVVAEGVEEQSCLDLLAALGCDFVQGFLLSRPLPASEFQGWLGRSAGRRRRWIGPAAAPHEEYLRLSPDAPPSGVR